MSESKYWDKFWQKRISRRRLMGGTLMVGGGLAAATVVGCSSADEGPNTNGGNNDDPDVIRKWNDFVNGTDANPYDYFDARRELTPAPTDSRGGTLTYIGFDPVVLDRYDPHQTQFGPMYSNQSAVFSKLYMYRSHDEPTWENIVPDLAESAPEMIGDPNAPTEYVIKIRQGVKFHDTDKIRQNFPDLAGRELTVDDVIFSYDRQRNADSPQWPYYYRSSQYSTIDRMEKVDDYTLRITTKEPVAPFFHFLADTNAMIIPQEIVDMEPGPNGQPWDSVDALADHGGPGPGDRMIGTGPFIWNSLQFGIEFNAVKNPAWFGWDDPDLGRPYLDGYKATGQGLNDATVESLFRRKEIDTAGFIDNPDWIVAIKEENPELEFLRAPTSGWLNTRFKVFCEPFDDWRVRRALFLAADRSQIVQIIGSGVWNVAGPITKAISYWALPEDELMALPGYRTDTAGRDADLQEARQLWEAAGNPEIPQIWFADVPGYISRYAPTYIQTTLSQNLGVDPDSVKYQTVPYSRIAEGLLKDDCDLGGFTWGFDNGWIDLDDWFYPYYITDGPKNSFRLSDPDLDALLIAQRREFDIDARKELGYEIQRYVLGEGPSGPEAPGAHCRIDYASPGGGTIAWPYVKNRTGWPWFGNNYWTAEVWFDQSDLSYQGRPG